MMALDHGRISSPAFHNIRIDRPLSQNMDLSDLFRFILKHTDEFFPDDPAFLFRLGYARQMREEALPGIYGGQRWSEEYQADLLETVVRFVLDSDRCSGTFLWQYCDTRSYISNCSQMCAGGFNSKGLLDRYRNPKISWRRISDLLRGNFKTKD